MFNAAAIRRAVADQEDVAVDADRASGWDSYVWGGRELAHFDPSSLHLEQFERCELALERRSSVSVRGRNGVTLVGGGI